jgi:NCS1 family nucleobase:cation symporter-1
MPLFGCLVSSATARIYGQPIWNPPELMYAWLSHNYNSGARAAAAFAGLGLGISQLATVVVDNAYSLGIDLSAVFPTFINIRRGSYIGLVLGMVMCPWELLSTASIFLVVISSFTVFFGPICGVQVCDYFFVRRRRIKLSDLYIAKSPAIYYYTKGFNWRPFVAWVVGWAPLFPGLLHAIKPTISVSQSAANLYFIAFILGFAISFLVYYALNAAFPPPGLGEVDSHDIFGTFTDEEGRALGISTTPSTENVEKIHDYAYGKDQGEQLNNHV